MEHTHSQLIALPIVPRRVREEVDNCWHYYDEKERCIFCDIIRQELETGERVIGENDHFITLSPYASRFPFEMWLLPKVHGSSFENNQSSMYARGAGPPGLQLYDPHLADRRRNQRSLSLAHGDYPEADQSGGVRMGHWFLYQSDASGRIGAVSARGANRNASEKIVTLRSRL